VITFFPGDGRNDIHTHGAFPIKAWVLQALAAAGFERNEVGQQHHFKAWKKVMAIATNRPQTGRLIVHAFASEVKDFGTL